MDCSFSDLSKLETWTCKHCLSKQFEKWSFTFHKRNRHVFNAPNFYTLKTPKKIRQIINCQKTVGKEENKKFVNPWSHLGCGLWKFIFRIQVIAKVFLWVKYRSCHNSSRVIHPWVVPAWITGQKTRIFSPFGIQFFSNHQWFWYCENDVNEMNSESGTMKFLLKR